MKTTRRKFIGQMGLATAGTLFVPLFLKGFDSVAANSIKNSNKKLIIIQFSGGNDGLNTVVPFRNDIYYKKRPQIAISKDEVIKLSDEQGLNPALLPLKKLYEEGEFTIINNVGYPNPDRSHFRSMDIWQTGSSSDEYLSTGWLGRYLDKIYTENKNAHFALEMDDTLSLALKGIKKSGFAAQDLNRLKRTTSTPIVKALLENQNNILKSNLKPHHDHSHDEQVSYLYQTLSNTAASSEYLFEKNKVGKASANYPNDRFGKALQQVSKLISAGSDSQIYYVSLNGFDTHANQKNQQERLFKSYAEGIEALRKDLKKTNDWNDTLIMTFSEFGRRVGENASRGTDHGTANVVFLAGGNLKKKQFVGQAPNLTDLDNGDLKFKIDFRQIYSDILKNWLKTDSRSILNADFENLGLV
ncbi:DUF1501 domain-containing protein [Bernardetia sp. Wsw4-3y2]|uniref:DUF1501 domain-containing protein n=1 Tax=Bernardetia sp. Wsw4-3y2 TaxID=3127471 RepID=UPI0030D200F0